MSVSGPVSSSPASKMRSDSDPDSFESRAAAVEREKAFALKEPGPGWRTWFLQSALRWYYFLGMLIVNINILVSWFEYGSLLGMVLSLVVAVYLEFLLYRFLWYRPNTDEAPRRPFRRSWIRPTEYGRWTPEADRVRGGFSIYPTEEGPSAREFL
jgi:hypothetical protein